jgi:hypothetical protein
MVYHADKDNKHRPLGRGWAEAFFMVIYDD